MGQLDLTDPSCANARIHCEPWWAWPLVADSPNAVLLFFVAALAFRVWAWRSKVLDALAFSLNLYVGVWTTVLFLSFPDAMGTFELGSTNNILFVTHMGMPLQALTLVHLMRRDTWTWRGAAAVVAFLALFVWVDYWGPHWHPAPFLHQGRGDQVLGLVGDRWLAVVSPLVMAGTAAAWLALARPWRKPRVPVEGD